MGRFATAVSTQNSTQRLASPAQKEYSRLGQHCSVLLQGSMDETNVFNGFHFSAD